MVKVIRLPSELAREYEQFAEAGGVSKAAFANILITLWLNQAGGLSMGTSVERMKPHPSDHRISLSLSPRIDSIARRIAHRKRCRTNDVLLAGIRHGLEQWKHLPDPARDDESETIFIGGEKA